MALHPSLVPEIGPDGIARESPVIAYTEKIIEEEQLQLRRYIEENYSKIRDVERELANLTFEVKLTAGPKKAALEHLRKKIEIATEKIRVAKIKEDETRKVWAAASQVVKDEEAIKQKLCDDLNQLVKESSNTQFSRLEELKRRLEALNPSKASTCDPPDGKSAQASTLLTSTSPHPPTAAQISETVDSHGSDGDASAANGHNQPQPFHGEGRGKKRGQNPVRGKGGIMVLPKGRGSLGPGWTGSGFDVDSRS